MKNKKILLIILPIILIFIVAAVIAFLYFATDVFKNNIELFGKYFAQNKEILNIMENENIKEQNNFKNANSYTLTGELSMSAQEGNNTQTINATTAARHDNNTGRTYSEMTFKNGEADLLKFSYINSDNVYAIKCDEILQNYIGIRNSDLRTFMQNMGADAQIVQNIPESIEFSSINEMATITEEQKNHIINTYKNTIIQSIPKDKFSKLNKTTITINGTNHEANAYQVNLDNETIKQVLINCLNTLKGDNITLVMISNKLTNLGVTTQNTDITALAENIDKIKTQLENTDTSNASNINIAITVYESKGKTIRTKIEMNVTETGNIQTMGNTTQEETVIEQGTTNTTTNVITIDMDKNEKTTKAIVSLQSGSNTSENAINTQITLEKNKEDNSIANRITIIPDINNMAQSIAINKSIGNVANNPINNSSDTTLNISSDGINIQTIQTAYIQTIQPASQVDEIMELKNSNTIIANNYKKEQLLPFLTQVGNKVSKLIPNKLSQLGIDLSARTQTGELAVNPSSLIGMLGTAGVNIANVNGVDLIGIGTTATVSLAINIYSNTTKILNSSNDAMNSQLVSAFNAQFKSYEGKQKGTVVKTLCETVKSSNASYAGDLSNQVLLQMNSASGITKEPTNEVMSSKIDEIKNQIKTNKEYIIDFGYSPNGKIVAIGITESK